MALRFNACGQPRQRRAGYADRVTGPYVYVWVYEVDPETRDQFRELYGPGGPWVDLFAKAPGYIGTQLLCDLDDSGRFITIDRWESEGAFAAFRSEYHDEFHRLDLMGEELTISETPIGEFGPADTG